MTRLGRLLTAVCVATPILWTSGAAGAQTGRPPQVPLSGGQTSTPLLDGSVLVVSKDSVAIFSPVTKGWIPAAPPAAPKLDHAAAVLPDGKVLFTGGYSDTSATPVVEVFDPVAKSWGAAPPMAQARYDHTATALTDGTVLVAGGRAAGHGPYLSQAERYDPATGTWRSAGEMPQGRAFHTATRLADGKVLVTGGQGAAHGASLRDALLFDPATDVWTAVPQLMSVGRASHTASLLPDGTVLVAGGTRQREGQQRSDLEASAEVFQPGSDAFVPTAPLHMARAKQAATTLPDGGVLVIGGEEANAPASGDALLAPSTAELYEPAARQWRTVASPREGAGVYTATTLTADCGRQCGAVLLVGPAGGRVYSTSDAVASADGDGTPWWLWGAIGAGLFGVALTSAIVWRRARAG